MLIRPCTGVAGGRANGFLKRLQPLGQGVPDRGPPHLAAKAICAPPGRGATFAHTELHAAATKVKTATRPTGTRLCAPGSPCTTRTILRT